MSENSRTPLVAGNWKMNKLIGEAVATVEALKPLVSGVNNVDIVVCPVFTALHAASQAALGSNIEVGAQNAYVKESGAYTGELSPQMLKDAGCAWTILGHSERRQYFGESDALLNEKLHFAVNSGLKVMFCIGETLEEREGGKMDDVLTRHVVEGLKGLTEAQFDQIAIAYEPVWAIGTGRTPTLTEIGEVHGFLRNRLKGLIGAAAMSVRLLYGGSVKPSNADEIFAVPDVDGALVGGASLKAGDFGAIIAALSAA